MDQYNILVLMEKDSKTGFLSSTVDSYKIDGNIQLIENAYLSREGDEYYIFITLTTADVEDYQYNGIYDLYNEDIFEGLGVEAMDGSGEYNPRWIIKIKYSEERSKIEDLLNKLLGIHETELERVLILVDKDKMKYSEEKE